jgi:hypothetical protein
MKWAAWANKLNFNPEKAFEFDAKYFENRAVAQ